MVNTTKDIAKKNKTGLIFPEHRVFRNKSNALKIITKKSSI